MAFPPTDPAATAGPRRPAADLIDAVVQRMRDELEPLKYSILAPGRYVVYVHPREFARIQEIIPILQQQTAQALDEELAKLNRRPILRRYVDRVLGGAVPVENPLGTWQIEFHADPDGELADGDMLIHAELILPVADELGAGQRTKRITTVHVSGRTTRREHTYTESRSSQPRPHARLVFEDDAGHHTFEIVRDSTTVGRGGIAYPVDVRIQSSVDISREHLRIRRDPSSGRFSLVDLSSLGTTLDGRPVPRGYDEVDGTKQENNVETPLPDRTRIGLADTVFIEFEVLRR